MSIVVGELLTYTGKRVRPLHIQQKDINIHDIAHSLSLTCRWGGHCERFISVAEHCLIVSRLVSQELALAGLLHDASEAYLVDLPAPIKMQPNMSDFRNMENRIMIEIENFFLIDGLSPDDWKKIKEADILSRRAEFEELMPGIAPEPLTNKEWKRINTIHPRIGSLDPENAEKAFLQRFLQLVERP